MWVCIRLDYFGYEDGNADKNFKGSSHLYKMNDISEMLIMKNPLRGVGLPDQDGIASGDVSSDVGNVTRLLNMCPMHKETPLRNMPELAALCGIAQLQIKDESVRMGLGSFKALGAAYAIAKEADRHVLKGAGVEAYRTALVGRTFVSASAGNHGLSIAAGARVFGAKAVIFLSAQVPEAFATRLRATFGAEVVRAGEVYEESMEAARLACEDSSKGWTLLSDSSWVGSGKLAIDVMEGYLAISYEILNVISSPPTHIMLQAGVGGLAAAMASALRRAWPDVVIVVVEPDQAPSCLESVRVGKPLEVTGRVSVMGRLDCKVPSHIALKALARDVDFFVTVTDIEAETCAAILTSSGVSTTSSGGAGVAPLLGREVVRRELGITTKSRVLCIVSECKPRYE